MDLELFKKHIRADSCDEDDYLLLLLDAAKSAVSGHISQPIDKDTIKYTNVGAVTCPSGDVWPELQMATLHIGAQLYANREPDAFAQAHAVAHTYEYLITPFKKFRDASGVT